MDEIEDVNAVIEQAFSQLRLEVDIGQPWTCGRMVTVSLFYGTVKITEASDTIPKERDDDY